MYTNFAHFLQPNFAILLHLKMILFLVQIDFVFLPTSNLFNLQHNGNFAFTISVLVFPVYIAFQPI